MCFTRYIFDSILQINELVFCSIHGLRRTSSAEAQMKRLLKFAVTYLFSSLATALLWLLWLLYIHPNFPRTVTGWGLLFLLALPAMLLGELIGEFAWKNPFARAISAQTSKRSLSGLRILYGLLVMLVVFGAALGISYYLSGAP
jgi:hypothetical protein